MFKSKLIKNLYKEIEKLKEENKVLIASVLNQYDKKYELQKELLDQKEIQEKKSREQILKEYDVAVLIKNGKTYLLEKGKEEKMIRSFTLTQYENNVPILETEKVLYERLY